MQEGGSQEGGQEGCQEGSGQEGCQEGCQDGARTGGQEGGGGSQTSGSTVGSDQALAGNQRQALRRSLANRGSGGTPPGLAASWLALTRGRRAPTYQRRGPSRARTRARRTPDHSREEEGRPGREPRRRQPGRVPGRCFRTTTTDLPSDASNAEVLYPELLPMAVKPLRRPPRVHGVR